MSEIKSIYAGSPKNPPAFCHSRIHPGYITVKEMRKHNCLAKQCPLLERFEDHTYWKQREVLKNKKKETRAAFAARVGGYNGSNYCC